MFQTDWLSECVTHQPFEYNDQKDITQGLLNEWNKEVNIQKTKKQTKKEHTWTQTQDFLVVNCVPKPLDRSVVQCKMFHYLHKYLQNSRKTYGKYQKSTEGKKYLVH